MKKHREIIWLEPLQENLNYKFKNIELLITALTHSSMPMKTN